MAEFDLIDLIRTRCAAVREDVRLGIGDDAALLAPPPGQLLVVSTDSLVAGVHFPHAASPYDIGWKALAVNLSDLAAMGATPAWATLTLTMPQADSGWVAQFADGFAALAAEFKLALVGGDTTRGELNIGVCVFGFVPRDAALLRSGARVGDAIFVTGTLGDAAAGLRCMDKSADDAQHLFNAPADTREALLTRLNRPVPRVAQGLALRGQANACIDVSDGLLADLGHICTASGVGAEIDLESLPASPALLRLFDADARAVLQASGGDDYELCFTANAQTSGALLGDIARSGCAATRIGRVVAKSGVRALDGAGRPVTLDRAGWEHFA